jgi:hypothetical protein
VNCLVFVVYIKKDSHPTIVVRGNLNLSEIIGFAEALKENINRLVGHEKVVDASKTIDKNQQVS